MHHILWNILGYIKTGHFTKNASSIHTIDFWIMLLFFLRYIWALNAITLFFMGLFIPYNKIFFVKLAKHIYFEYSYTVSNYFTMSYLCLNLVICCHTLTTFSFSHRHTYFETTHFVSSWCVTHKCEKSPTKSQLIILHRNSHTLWAWLCISLCLMHTILLMRSYVFQFFQVLNKINGLRMSSAPANYNET